MAVRLAPVNQSHRDLGRGRQRTVCLQAVAALDLPRSLLRAGSVLLTEFRRFVTSHTVRPGVQVPVSRGMSRRSLSS